MYIGHVKIYPELITFYYIKGDARYGESSSSFFVQTLRMFQGIMSENNFEKFAVFTEIFAFK